MITGARPSVGSSSSSTCGSAISARAIASICCSPPLSWLPGRPDARARFGNSSSSFGTVQSPLRPDARPSSMFSSTVRFGKMCLPCGTRLTPRLAGSYLRLPSALPLDEDLAAHGRHAEDRQQRRRLAGAVAADQADGLAGVDLEVDAVEHARAAVGGVDVLELQQRGHPSAPQVGLDDTLDRSRTAFGSPVASTLPSDEHRDLVADAEDAVDVVLDEHGGDVALRAQRPDVVEHPHRLLVREAGAGLVEQHDVRLADERHRDVDRALEPVGDRVARLCRGTAAGRARR